MGQRARRGGIATAAIRAARAVAREQDDEAAQIAQGIYETAVEVKGERGVTPLYLLAAITYVAEQAGPRVAAHYGLTGREEELSAYLAAGLFELHANMVAAFNVAHFEEWCETTAEAKVRAEAEL